MLDESSFKVFAVVVTYNGMKWIDRCLSSLLDSSIHVDVVVVDNGSIDNTVSYIRNNYEKNVFLIESKINLGFGQANNKGIEYAYANGATHFLLINQDAWFVASDHLEHLLDVQEKYALDIVSPIHLNINQKLLDANFLSYLVVHSPTLFSDLLVSEVKEYYPIRFVNAAIWIIGKATIDSIGGFDPLFFHYAEDSNYVDRLIFHGKRICIVPSCFAVHDRLQFGNEKAYKKNKMYRMLLREYSMLNYPLLSLNKEKFRIHLSIFKLAMKALCKLHFTEFFLLIKEHALFIFQIPEIHAHRLKNKKLGTHWLNLQ